MEVKTLEQKDLKLTTEFILKELEKNGSVCVILDLFLKEDIQRILDSIRIVGYNVRCISKGCYRFS